MKEYILRADLVETKFAALWACSENCYDNKRQIEACLNRIEADGYCRTQVLIYSYSIKNADEGLKEVMIDANFGGMACLYISERGSISCDPEKYDRFQKALSEKDVTIYPLNEQTINPHKQFILKKERFGMFWNFDH